MLTPVPPSDCSRAREAASARLDGELTELEGARLDAHLLACDDCRRYLAEIGAVARTLRAASLEEPQLAAFVPRRRGWITVHAAAAAVVIAAVTGASFELGQLIGSQGSGRTATVATRAGAKASPRQAELTGIVRKPGAARMIVNKVVPV
jgi:predicted anti-sigma-YlaC factor YlaD